MPIVAMPDGARVQFPDDMSPDQIRGMIATKFPDASKQTFLDKLGGDLSNRWQQGQKDVHNYPAMAPIVGLGVATGAVNDIAGAVTNAVIPDVVKQGLKTGADAAAGALDNTSIGQGIGDKLLAATDWGTNFMQNNPKSAIALRATGNVASFIPTERTIESAVNAVAPIAENAVNGVQGLADQYAAKYPVGTGPLDPVEIKTLPTQAQITAGAQKKYDVLDSMGGGVVPAGTDKLVNIAQRATAGVTPEERAFGITSPIVNDMSTRLDNIRGMPLSMQGLDGIDTQFQNAIKQTARAGDDVSTNQLRDMRDAFRNARSNLTPQDLTNPDAFDAWRDADTLYAAKSKMEDIQDAIDTGQKKVNPVNGQRAQFESLYNRLKKNSMGYTPDEIATIGEASETGIVTNGLRSLGNKWIAGMVGGLAGLPGGVPGGMAGVALGEAAGFPFRWAANALQKSRGNDVKDLIASRSSVEKALARTDYAPDAAPKQLTYQAEPKTMVSNSYGQTIPIGSSDRMILGQSAPTKNMMMLAAPEAKSSFIAEWDKLTAAEQAKIDSQTSKMWASQKISLPDMITQAKQNVDDLLTAKGMQIKNPAMRDALLGAGRQPTMQEIMQMKPADARAALALYQSNRIAK